MNEAERFVRHCADGFGRLGGAPFAYTFLAKHGLSMEAPAGHRLNGTMPRKQCFENALLMADATGLVYCEGYGVFPGLPLPVEHAWLWDEAAACAIDPTWPKGGTYFGVRLKTAEVARLLLDIKVYGVLPNLFMLHEDASDIEPRMEGALWHPPVTHRP